MSAQRKPTPASIVLRRSIVDFVVRFFLLRVVMMGPGVRALALFLSGAHCLHY